MHHKRQPDALAVELANTTLEKEDCEAAILFGSQAWGDHQGHSDIDLLVLVCHQHSEDELIELNRRALGRADSIYRDPGQAPPVQAVPMLIGTYQQRMKRTLSHIAGQAARQGHIAARTPER